MRPAHISESSPHERAARASPPPVLRAFSRGLKTLVITEREAEGRGRLWALERHWEQDGGSRCLSNICASHVGRWPPRQSACFAPSLDQPQVGPQRRWPSLSSGWDPVGRLPPGTGSGSCTGDAELQGMRLPVPPLVWFPQHFFGSTFLGVPTPDQGPARDKENSSLPPGARVLLLKHAPPAGRALTLHREGPHP